MKNRIIKWKSPAAHSEYDGLHKSWYDMHQRAGNKNGENPSYSDVTVCERWYSYDNFFEDMADTWFQHAHLDKDIIKPGNKIYCPEYCKWISIQENSKEMWNRRRNNHPQIKKVQCIETSEIYCGAYEAERILSLKRGSVGRAANPKQNTKTAGGYHWKYI